MKKLFLVNILVCLLIGGGVQAVQYTPYRGAQRISNSSSAAAAPTQMLFRSTSTYATPVGYTSSASFDANGIAKAPKSGLRSSLGGGGGNLERDENDEATGRIGNDTPADGGLGAGKGETKDTPIGNAPIIFILILAWIYLIFGQKRIKITK